MRGTSWTPPLHPAGFTVEAVKLVMAKAMGAAMVVALTAAAVVGGVIARETPVHAAVVLAQAGVAGVQAQAPAAPGGQLVVQRESAERDLVWLLAGIMDMDRDKKLALTRKQATDIWPTFKALVDKGLIRLEVDPAQLEFRNRSGWQGQAQGQGQGQSQGQGQGGTAQMDGARAQELRKQRQAREEALRQAIDNIEKTLSAKQLAYVDNFDFDPANYGLALGLGGARPQGAQNQGQWTPPSQQDMQQLMKMARENAQKLADFYNKFHAFIQKRAGIKA
ncbi:MAG: hypothetical protein ACM3X3_01130 [Betaproteobacteria bacterium]